MSFESICNAVRKRLKVSCQANERIKRKTVVGLAADELATEATGVGVGWETGKATGS